jgi:transcriptional regulator with XRE-family HTH domain
MSLPNNIRNFRLQAGMSQNELAEKAGVDQSAICKMEKGVFVPTVMVLDEIADVLKVTIDDLLHGESKSK